jgi:hypothetical protein
MARVIVYDLAIQGLFDPGESAVEWTKDVIDSILARAENIEVPRGGPTSGRIRQGWRSLARSHKSSGVLRRGPYGAGGSAYNDAPHAAWVHNGTTGPILPTSGRYLALPVAPGTLVRRANDSGRWRQNRAGGRPQPVRAIVLVGSVSGQEANPWLKRAGDAVVGEFRAKAYYRAAGVRSSAGLRRS